MEILDSIPVQLTILAFIIFTLFAANVAALYSAPDYVNDYINAVLIVCIVLFSVEIILSALCRPRRQWMLLALDAVATASILIDITWFATLVCYDNCASTSKAAIISSRASRIIRLVRLLRVLRLVGVVSVLMKRMLGKEVPKKAKDDADKMAPTNLGNVLIETTTVQV